MRWQPRQAVLLALVAAAGVGVALGARAATSSPGTPSTTTWTESATGPQTTQAPPARPTTTAATTTAPPSQPPPAPKPRSLGWPGGSGWTVILASIPAARGRAAAFDEARAAVRRGVDEVGVLLSAGYRSLRPGYWVVFAGVYRSRARAQSALADLRAHGFAGAYPRLVSSS